MKVQITTSGQYFQNKKSHPDPGRKTTLTMNARIVDGHTGQSKIKNEYEGCQALKYTKTSRA